MKCKKIEVPIYGCDLTIIFTKDLNEVVKKYKLKGDWGNYGALTFSDKPKFRNYVVAFTDANLSEVIPWCLHLWFWWQSSPP